MPKKVKTTTKKGGSKKIVKKGGSKSTKKQTGGWGSAPNANPNNK